MGQDYSLPGDLVTHFTMEELKRLGKRFRKLDTDHSGTLSIEEFMHLPELQQNPLVQRVVDIFDTDGNKEIDFREFIEGISQFSVKGDKNSKLKFAFQVQIWGFLFLRGGGEGVFLVSFCRYFGISTRARKDDRLRNSRFCPGIWLQGDLGFC